MATMESLIGLVNRIQRACTVVGDYGGGKYDNAFSSLWEALPSVAVIDGQALVGFAIVQNRGWMQEYAEFVHLPKCRFIDFCE
ncbi:hypothetical protein Nepgr_003651 [Nepenthes gracilis]|uniref:Uncharacterized protein n=1 Tax=Nepenthes gracilis TaxID=150966 RepID=A0AAD3XE07_NEPGR|nr:hypothetical protein Nepgr_003651 [Nepenthes gracilis]